MTSFEKCRTCPDLFDNHGSVKQQRCIECQNKDVEEIKKEKVSQSEVLRIYRAIFKSGA